jgi:hypothetical protein
VEVVYSASFEGEHVCRVVCLSARSDAGGDGDYGDGDGQTNVGVAHTKQ